MKLKWIDWYVAAALIFLCVMWIVTDHKKDNLQQKIDSLEHENAVLTDQVWNLNQHLMKE